MDVSPLDMPGDTADQRIARTLARMVRDNYQASTWAFYYEARQYRLTDGLQIFTLELPQSNLTGQQAIAYREA